MFGKDHWSDKKCAACPHKGHDRPCPCWVDAVEGMTETNVTTGEERVVTGCFYQVIPRLMVHVVKASNRPAAEMSAMRNSIDKVVDTSEHNAKLAIAALGSVLGKVQQAGVSPTKLLEITDESGIERTESD